MACFSRNKYIAAARETIGRKQYIADQIKKEENFNRRLATINEIRANTPIKELPNKNEIINTGIQYAYQDKLLEGLDNAPENLKKLVLFNRGYEVGLRRIKAEGYAYGINGFDLEDSELKDHFAFVEGYNSAYKTMENIAKSRKRK